MNGSDNSAFSIWSETKLHQLIHYHLPSIMTRVLSILSMMFTRLLFIGHGTVAVYTLLHHKPNNQQPPEHYYIPCAPIVCLCIETILTLWNENSTKCRYFWPCGFFYFSTIIPIVWIIELEQFQFRDKRRTKTILLGQNSTTFTYSHDENTGDHHSVLLFNVVHLDEHDLVNHVCEVGLFIGLIIGRWLLPRGSMTRDQLSGLLMGYVGASADILEIFELLQEEEVMHEKRITLAALTLYTVSSLQFSLESTLLVHTDEIGEVGEKKNDKSNGSGGKEILMKSRPVHNFAVHRHRYRNDIPRTTKKTVNENSEPTQKTEGQKPRKPQNEQKTFYIKTQKNPKKKEKPIKSKMELKIAESKAAKQREIVEKRQEVRSEVFQILVTLLSHDIPFLLMRVCLIAWYGMISESHVFYTCKNFLVTVLLLYRLYILKTTDVNAPDTCTGEAEAQQKLHALKQLVAAHET